MSIIRIGSFNLCKFQDYKSNSESRKDFSKIAQIINDNKFDVVGLQEVFGDETAKNGGPVLDRLLAYLPGWKGCWNYPRKAAEGAAEGYAFIYNNYRLTLDRCHIWEQYKINRHSFQQRLAREPLYARFKFNSLPFFDLRLVNTHIMFNKNSLHDESINLSDVQMRRKELEILLSAVYPRIEDKIYGDNMRGCTILLGDYNLVIKGSQSRMVSAYIPEELACCNTMGNKQIITVQDLPTTIRQAPSEQDQHSIDNDFWANNYDHFSYNVRSLQSYNPQSSRINSVTSYCTNYLEHRIMVSDHVPILLEINI